MRIASRWLWFASGALFAGTLGGPLVGATSVLLRDWTANDRERLVNDVEDAAYRYEPWEPRGAFRPQGPCEAAGMMAVVAQPDRQRLQLENALQTYRKYVASYTTRNADADAIDRLSLPVIGGLLGCFRASALSGACGRYVHGLEDAGRVKSKPRLDASVAKADRDAEAAWCAANRGIPH